MAKQKTTHQLRRAAGLDRIGGAASRGSTKLPDDIGSRSAARLNDALAEIKPDPQRLTIAGSRQFADVYPASYAHGSMRGAKDVPGNGKAGMLRGTVADGLQARQWKGRA